MLTHVLACTARELPRLLPAAGMLLYVMLVSPQLWFETGLAVRPEGEPLAAYTFSTAFVIGSPPNPETLNTRWLCVLGELSARSLLRVPKFFAG